MRERIDELDVIRALAFLGVVLQHALGVFIRQSDIALSNSIILGIVFNLVKFAVPTFVFVTGIVLLFNYYDRFHYPRFIWKRVQDILIPYFIWTILYLFYYFGVPVLDWVWIRMMIKNLILGEGAYHLWYVIMIFQVYLFFPILLFLFKKGREYLSRPVYALVLLGFSYTLLMWFSSTYIPGHKFHVSNLFLDMAFIEYRGRNFLYYSYYFILGGAAGLAIVKWRATLSKYVVWTVLAFLVLFLWVTKELLIGVEDHIVNLNISTSLKPSMFLYTLAEIALIYLLAQAIVKGMPYLHRMLKFVSDYSFGAYLVHALILTYTVRFLGFVEHHLIATLLAFLLTSFLSVGITYMLSHIPMGYWLTGYKPRKK